MTPARVIEPQPKLLSSLRVFISSTFRDMQAERKALLFECFPSVRADCARDGLAFQDIDLRWGITAEEAEAGDVLKICLDEIDACRPHFVCMIGGRYGWIDPEAANRLARWFPHLVEYADRSATELEIRHAVLNPPPGAMPCNALFYVRELAIDGSPDAAPIRRLLSDIVAAGYRTHPYKDEHELAAMIARDVAPWRIALKSALPDRQSAVDQAAFEAMVLSGGFQRPKLVAQLLGLVAENRDVVVSGPVGAGKSALLCAAARSSAPEMGIESNSRGGIAARLRALLGARPRNRPMHLASLAAMGGSWRRLAAELCDLASRHASGDTVADFDALLSTFDGTLAIDDLDAAEDQMFDPAVSWLAREERRARLVVSTASERLVAAFAARGFAVLSLPPLDMEDRVAIGAATLAAYGKRLDAKQARMLAEAPSHEPAHIRIICEEMRNLGIFEQVDEKLDGLTRVGARQAVEAMLDRIAQASDAALVRSVGRYLLAGRIGVSEREIAMAIGEPGAPVPERRLAPVLHALKPYLFDRRGVLSVAASRLEEALRSRSGMADSELTAERTRLVEILLDEPFSDRSLDELPWLVETLASTDAVALLLSDIAWLDRLLRRDGIAGLAFAARSRFWAPAAMEACVHVCLGVIDSAGIDFVASAIRLLDALGSTVAAAEALSARRQGGVPLDDEALSAAADCYLAAGRFDDALSALRELRTMSRDAAREIAVQERAGAVALAAGDHVASIALFEEAVAAHEARGDRHSAARARANLGLARMAGGAPRSGLRELSRAEREARLRGDYELLALALGGQGRAYRLLGAPRPALEKLGVEAAYWRRSGSAARLAQNLVEQAACRIDLDDYDGSSALYVQALAEAERAGDFAIRRTAIEGRLAMLARVGMSESVTALQLRQSLDRPDARSA